MISFINDKIFDCISTDSLLMDTNLNKELLYYQSYLINFMF